MGILNQLILHIYVVDLFSESFNGFKESSLKKIFVTLFNVLVIFGAVDLQAACVIQNSNGQPMGDKGDPLFSILRNSGECPENVQGLKAVLNQAGLDSQPHMVANRGIHNPSFGSFSFFEQVSGASPLLKKQIEAGEFFFGHFTTAENNQVVADQEPTKGKLLIELIAWDQVKNLFNFYELIGTGKGAQWFYRGDSADILADNAFLYLNSKAPNFGSTLRCSACHTSGGPIMKEMAAPHNDWWTESRPLSFAPNSVSPEISNWLQKLRDASELSESVRKGIIRLESSSQYQNARQKISLQATLRPLFCETEINLESDTVPLDEIESRVQIPSGFIVNPLLAKGSLSVSGSMYERLLNSFGMQFPETDRRDADHPWLVPVKGYSDLIAIESLIARRIVTDEFVADVLAVDFEKPLFSAKRCSLLKLVPATGLAQFPDQLKASSLPGARELYENLVNSERTKNFHIQKAQRLLDKVQSSLETSLGQMQMFKNMIDARREVFSAEISKNPQGQILEPGFRVIFPVPLSTSVARPGSAY